MLNIKIITGVNVSSGYVNKIATQKPTIQCGAVLRVSALRPEESAKEASQIAGELRPQLEPQQKSQKQTRGTNRITGILVLSNGMKGTTTIDSNWTARGTSVDRFHHNSARRTGDRAQEAGSRRYARKVRPSINSS
jgi:hypothetical protein